MFVFLKQINMLIYFKNICIFYHSYILVQVRIAFFVKIEKRVKPSNQKIVLNVI